MGTVIHNMDVNNYDDDLNDGKTDTHDSDVDNDEDVCTAIGLCHAHCRVGDGFDLGALGMAPKVE